MTQHRVDELHLDIHVPAGHEDGLQPLAESFTRQAVEDCGDLLEERYPGHVFLVQRLPVRWDLEDRDLTDPSLIRDCARELASAVEALKGFGTARPSERDNVAVFEGDAAWKAAYLNARATGSGAAAWFYEVLAQRGVSLGSFAAGEMVAVLRCLAESGDLTVVLEKASAAELQTLARTLELRFGGAEEVAGAEEPALGGTLREWASHDRGPALFEALIARARELPAGLPRIAAAIALYFEGERVVGATKPETLRAAVAEALETAIPGEERPAAADGASPEASSGAELPVELSGPERLSTEFGGLFFLISLVLELGLGEALWKACLPEGLVLARALRWFLPRENASDPALSILGGVENLDCRLEVTAEQQQEVSLALVERLAVALPRHGLAALPETTLGLYEGGAGRLIAASPAGSLMPVFVWPAANAEELQQGLRGFLNAWPRSAPPVLALPGFAQLDPSGRVKGSREAIPSSPLAPHPEPSPTSALLAHITGVLGYLFAARAGDPAARAETLRARYFEIPAQIELSQDLVDAALPMESVKLELRRAGLDRDPGRVPWLRKKVCFRFEGDDAENIYIKPRDR